MNGYGNRQIRRAFQQQKRSRDQDEEETEEERKALAVLPFAGNVSSKIGRLLKKYNISTVFRQPAKTRTLLGTVKDDLGLKKAGVYKIPSSCGKSYIGQTVRTVEDQCKEHQRHTRLCQPSQSALAEHCINTGHSANYEETEILASTNTYWDSVFKEAIEIRVTNDLINRDTGFQLSKAWKPILSTIMEQRYARTRDPSATATGDELRPPLPAAAAASPTTRRAAGRRRRETSLDPAGISTTDREQTDHSISTT